MQRCILIGAGDCNVQKIETKPEDFVIAVDGGYDTCRKYDIVPDLIVGDFDSVQESDMPQIVEIAKIAPDHVVLLPTEKDDTDMLAAIRIGLLEGCQEFRIYGGMGGRLEHTLANLQCLIYLKQCSAVGYLMDDKTTAFVMQNETVWFKPEAKGFLSLFSLGEKASGVTIRNLKYEMQSKCLLFLGGISYFYYLSHIRVGYVFITYMQIDSIIVWCILTTLIAYLFNKAYFYVVK